MASGALGGSGKAQKFSLQVIAKYYSGGSHKSVDEEGAEEQQQVLSNHMSCVVFQCRTCWIH